MHYVLHASQIKINRQTCLLFIFKYFNSSVFCICQHIELKDIFLKNSKEIQYVEQYSLGMCYSSMTWATSNITKIYAFFNLATWAKALYINIFFHSQSKHSQYSLSVSILHSVTMNIHASAHIAMNILLLTSLNISIHHNEKPKSFTWGVLSQCSLHVIQCKPHK